MKIRLTAILVIMVLTTFGGISSANAQDPVESWTNPTYKKKKYKKVMVIAPFSPPTYRKRFEKYLVDGLKDRGIKAFSSTDIITNEELIDTALLLKKILDSKADGVVVLNYLAGASKTTEQLDFTGPVYIYGWAFANFDLETRTVKAGLVQLDFYTPPTRGTQYRSGVILNMTNNSDTILEEFKIKATKKLTGDKIL
ncbi:MAG TPA: hypothetical protein VK166_06555 [Chitinophagaceae bacterium]|nr:hypothetical protein [Chitinophagaceae bacterium]